ncbi:MAG: ISKra4 family transposase [Candidatus Sericytochromatia bacterium]|nr:ISKra4 family transposase [Candidatus Tanganyikabacteria bacterium]
MLEAIIEGLSSEESLGMDHSAIESRLFGDGFELLRQLYQAYLDLRAIREVPQPSVLGADGEERTHRRPTSRELESLFGGVRARRIAYGGRGISSLHPADAALNLPPDLFSFGVRRRVAEEAARGAFDAVVEAIAATTGASIGKRQAQELAAKAAVDFDDFYAQTTESDGVGGRKSFLVISADGKGIVTLHEDLREATQKAAEKTSRKLAKRLAPGEKLNRKRMATVAAVYTIGKFVRTPEDIVDDLRRQKKAEKRPRPKGKRVWASVEKATEEVLRAAFAEAHGRDPEHKKTWVALVDGNATQIQLLRKLAKEYQVELVIILDLIHVIEYLWGAAHVFHKAGTQEAEAYVSERLLKILWGEAGYVAGGVRRSATNRGLDKAARKAVDDCARYFLNHTDLMRYHEFLAAGMPVATGVIEGACRHLIADRMDITGARWSLEGAEAILRLRSLRSSGDFDEYWRFHEEQERERNHATLFAVPLTQPDAEDSAVLAG